MGGDNAGRYFFAKNLEGDVVAIYDTSGTLKARYFYLAYGEAVVLNLNGSDNYDATFIGNVNPFRYRGYYYDTETSLYYLNSRYYDPETGRFINADDASMLMLGMSTLGGTNLFAYCLNNPIMETDPSGHFGLLISLAIIFTIGALSGVAGTLIGDAVNAAATGQWQWSSWETYAGAAIGYGVGALFISINPALGLAIGSGLSTFTAMSLEKATGTNDRSWWEITGWTAVSFTIGGVIGHFTKGLPVSKITTGRGSFQHVMRTQFTNMIRHGHNISFKTAAKSFVALTVSRQIVGRIVKGLYRAAAPQLWEYIVYGGAYS